MEIARTTNSAYCYQWTELVEGMSCTILDTVRSLLTEVAMRIGFWSGAIMYAPNMRNTIPSQALGMKTPFEELLGRAPNNFNIKLFWLSHIHS